MIEELEITNLGIIANACLPFGPGLNVLTGETGAGKTMVLNSVQLLLGARGSAQYVMSGSSSCEVVSTFGVSTDWITKFHVDLADKGAILDERESPPHGLIISRELTSQGRSKAFLGGKHVPVGSIADITNSLIAVHGQTDQIRLRDPQEQLVLLDRAGGPQRIAEVHEYQDARRHWRSLVKARNSLISHRDENTLKAQMLSLGLAEINQVAPEIDEDTHLQATLNIMRSAEAIRYLIASARETLSERDTDQLSVTSQLAAVMKDVDSASEHDPGINTYVERLNSVVSEVIDIDAELADYVRALNADPARLEAMEQRLASIKVLMKKYGPSISDIHEWDRAAQEQLPQLKISDEDIAQLDSDIISAQKKLIELGDQLSASRQNSAIELAQKIEQELRQLAMPRARISIEVKSQSDPSKWARSGADVVEFTIAADGGDQFRPMGTTVSGGELSRLMLAIEVALSSEHAVPTMIFDEVDAGIGGEVAVQVGRRLAQLGERIQVIVVTHLPQVAAFAQTHFVVDKSSLSGQVTTTVTEVKGEERTREITRMLSGLPDSASGAAHAEELLEMARG
jgi:DNA repair protein RecN (Recombination protein N)